MKKKVIALILYVALLMTSLIPATALAENGTEGTGTEGTASVCTCESKCSEGNVNAECPVCSAEGAALAEVCKGEAGPSTRSATVLTINNVQLDTKTYDGTTEGTVTAVSFTGVSEGQSLEPGQDYTATVEYGSADAGPDKTATVTVKLTNSNYSFADGKMETTYPLYNQTIKKRPVELAWETTVFTYDGTEKSVSATISNVVGNDDVKPDYDDTSTTSAIDAIEGSYTATVTGLRGEDAGNYTLVGGTNTSHEWSIKIDITYGTTVSYNGYSRLCYYNGKAQEPYFQISVYIESGIMLSYGRDYTLSYKDNINAGRATIMVNGTGKYTGTAYGYFTINPCPLTITGADLAPKTYDGSTEGVVNGVSFSGMPTTQSPFVLGDDYSATVEYDSADAGDDRTATVTVTMINGNYSFGNGGKVAIYKLNDQEIAKADYKGETSATGYVVSNSSLHSVKLPELPEGASYGGPEYSGGDDAVTDLDIENGILHYTGGSGIVVNDKYTVTVPVDGGSNYNYYDITVTLTGSDNVVLSGAPTLSSDTITYGDRLSDITLSGSMYAGATPVSGSFTWDAPETMPKAGDYPAQWTFTSNEGTATATDSTQITVKQRPVVLDWGTTVFTYDGNTHSVSASITNIVEGDSVQPVYGNGTLSATEIKTYFATVIDLSGTGADNYTLTGVANASQEWSIKPAVTLVSSVTMSRSSLRIYEGRSYTLSATVKPDDATDRGIVWSSSDNSIATVDQKGTVTGHKPGTVTVTATAADGSGVSASCVVRVLRWYPGATPITGDSSHLGLWIGVLAVSAAAIGAGAFILIKKQRKK